MHVLSAKNLTMAISPITTNSVILMPILQAYSLPTYLPRFLQLCGGLMKELWNTLRLAFYVVALPLLATATLAADRFFSDGENQEEIIPVKSSVTTFVAQSSRSHAFVRDGDDFVSGRVIRFDTESGMSVANAGAHVVFMRDNKSILSVVTDENGMFKTNELQPGPYSIVATSADGFATFGAHVVDGDPSNARVVEIATVPPGSQRVHEILSKPRGGSASLSEMAAQNGCRFEDIEHWRRLL